MLLGKEVVDAMGEAAVSRVEALRNRGVVPTLAIVRMGERPDDLSYERTAVKRAEKLGVSVRTFVLDADASEEELLDVIGEVNEDDGIHGCLMFRPLPAHIDSEKVRNAIAAEKDLDCISDDALGRFFTGKKDAFAPCTAESCIEILKHYGVEISGKRAVVILSLIHI